MELDIAAASRSRISRSRVSQLGKWIGRWCWSREEPEHPLRDARPEDRLARRNRPDRPANLLLLGALDHVATSTGAHGSEHRVVIVEHGQHQDGNLGC